MTGGIFPNYPFELNIKCVIFSIIIMTLFLYKPPEMNPWTKTLVLTFIFIVSYVAMAWYDYKFNCTKLALKKSTHGVTDYFKPPPHSESQTDRSKMTPEEKDFEWQLINLYHILILAPLFLYVGINKLDRNSIYNNLISVNLVFGIIYHIVRLPKLFNKATYGGFISLMHVLFGALGVYYLNQPQISDNFYTILNVIGVYAAMKHGYYLMVQSH